MHAACCTCISECVWVVVHWLLSTPSLCVLLLQAGPDSCCNRPVCCTQVLNACFSEEETECVCGVEGCSHLVRQPLTLYMVCAPQSCGSFLGQVQMSLFGVCSRGELGTLSRVVVAQQTLLFARRIPLSKCVWAVLTTLQDPFRSAHVCLPRTKTVLPTTWRVALLPEIAGAPALHRCALPFWLLPRCFLPFSLLSVNPVACWQLLAFHLAVHLTCKHCAKTKCCFDVQCGVAWHLQAAPPAQ